MGKPMRPYQIVFARKVEKLGAGEVVVKAVDRDDVMKGYDIDLARKIRDAISLSMTVLGGAGSLQDIGAMIDSFGIIGAAAGSLFVCKGVYRAGLISYPNRIEKDALIMQIRQSTFSFGRCSRRKCLIRDSIQK